MPGLCWSVACSPYWHHFFNLFVPFVQHSSAPGCFLSKKGASAADACLWLSSCMSCSLVMDLGNWWTWIITSTNSHDSCHTSIACCIFMMKHPPPAVFSEIMLAWTDTLLCDHCLPFSDGVVSVHHCHILNVHLFIHHWYEHGTPTVDHPTVRFVDVY